MAGKISRRAFTKTTNAAGALAALPASAKARASNDRSRLGFIGVGNRGDQLLDAFLVHKDCQVIALCDVYEPYLEPANRKAGGKATLHRDFRKLVEEKDVDAVVI